ncbi:TPA: hypothetical protein H1012_00115 [archaeon]|nr:hypothetical protein [Candidatus Naiadarchaeales archaeon SRR2090153.bin461]HIK02235.1 hypothetical protein [Candidatus Naiadarchaeales archaeon SRR2090159.bin1288]
MRTCIYCRHGLKKEDSFDYLTSGVITAIAKEPALARIWMNQQRNRGDRAKFTKIYFCSNCASLYIPAPQVPQDRH